ncbi:MAG: UDP-N-acetylenolpyruvoylglucosamine reductase [Parcubacteria group bacterium GW2011_GWB1_44_7]|nr:MAG: UDP-N-acetylenolpyruvoylglucosamine reductase [Parcubacteria group bacterium GW2011_GWB1_44_7]
MAINDIPNLRHAVSLKSYNTYRVGGEAKFFYEAHDWRALERAVSAARESSVPFYILGGGTNVLASDKGFDGLVIKMMAGKVSMAGEVMHAASGVSMGALVNKAKALGLSGLEWAAGLPGTLGGAIYGNAGSCGSETANIMETVEAFDPISGRLKRYAKHECEFGYRNSIFKSNKEIILGAILRLKKSDPEAVMKKMIENMKFRQEHQPLSEMSAGCVFKNIEIAKCPAAAYLTEHNPEFSRFKSARFLPAGFLIDNIGLKGLKIGGVEVSERHANFLVVNKNATQEDISWIIKMIKEKVSDVYKINLEEEIQIITN